MNRLKTCLIFCFVLSVFNVSAQFTTEFNEIHYYTFQCKTSLSPEKALNLSYFISNIDDVIICRADVAGQVSIFCNEQINIKLFKERLAEFPDLSFSKITESTASKSLFLKTYALMVYPEVTEYSGNSFDVISLNDKAKQEMSFGVAKSIWVEQYPENYKNGIPTDVEKTTEEQNEKATKGSNIDLKSKQK